MKRTQHPRIVSTSASANMLPHVVQLDGLRAIAVGFVFFHHFIAQQRHEELPFELGQIHWGFVGVQLFFILSGFLITLILLQGRQMAEGVAGGWQYILRQFYLRRFLRIMPLAYLVIAVAAIFNYRHTREIAGWLASYTINIQMAIAGVWPRRFNHFWTLAIEEQFYLVWPFVILCSPRRWMPALIGGAIALGPIYRCASLLLGWNDLAVRHLTFAWFDSLAAGALLALLVDQGLGLKASAWLRRVGLPIGLATTLLLEFWDAIHPHARLTLVFGDLSMTLIGCWLVLGAYYGFSGFWGRLLSWRPVAYLGKISYGLYVYHLFIRALLNPWLIKIGVHSIVLRALVDSLASIAIAAVSWHFFESPINALKRFVPYALPKQSTKKEGVMASRIPSRLEKAEQPV